MKLSADHAIDAIELRWAQQVRSATFNVERIGEASGRSADEWAKALASEWAPYPSNETIEERFAVVAAAVLAGRTVVATSALARAPRNWCAEAMRRLFEPERIGDWLTPELIGPTRPRLAPPIHPTQGRRP